MLFGTATLLCGTWAKRDHWKPGETINQWRPGAITDTRNKREPWAREVLEPSTTARTQKEPWVSGDQTPLETQKPAGTMNQWRPVVNLNTKNAKILEVLARPILQTFLPRMNLGRKESWDWSRLARMRTTYPWYLGRNKTSIRGFLMSSCTCILSIRTGLWQWKMR